MSNTLASASGTSFSSVTQFPWTSNSKYLVFSCNTFDSSGNPIQVAGPNSGQVNWTSYPDFGFRFQLTNSGSVSGNFEWQIQFDTSNPTAPKIQNYSYMSFPNSGTSINPVSSSNFGTNIIYAFNKSTGTISFNFKVDGSTLYVYAGTSLGKYPIFSFDTSSFTSDIILNSKSQFSVLGLQYSGYSFPTNATYSVSTKGGMNTLSIVLLVVLLIVIVVIIIVIIVVVVVAVKKKKKSSF